MPSNQSRLRALERLATTPIAFFGDGKRCHSDTCPEGIRCDQGRMQTRLSARSSGAWKALDRAEDLIQN
jgi:hypothetical protein